MSRRAKRWKIKTDPALWHPRLEALHPISSELIAKAYTSIDEVYTHVRKILDKHGIIVQSRLLYRSFIEELWELSRKYRGKTFNIEGGAVAIKYLCYGADMDVIYELSFLFNLKREHIEKVLGDAFAMTFEEAMKSALREEVRKLAILAKVTDYTIPAGETHYLPDKVTDPAAALGVSVEGYSKKTISFLFDAELEYTVEVSDNRVDWIRIHPPERSISGHPWWEADALYARLKVYNPLATDQRVIICTFKGRRLG